MAYRCRYPATPVYWSIALVRSTARREHLNANDIKQENLLCSDYDGVSCNHMEDYRESDRPNAQDEQRRERGRLKRDHQAVENKKPRSLREPPRSN